MLLAKRLHHGVNTSSILDSVGKDAGIYFAVMASSHFVVVVLFAAARVRSLAQMLEFNVLTVESASQPGLRGLGIV